MDPLIYLDYNATTAVDPQVLQAMLPHFNQQYANASSTLYKAGKSAAECVEDARNKLASLLHCQAKEIYFTSGATEAINWALKGAFERFKSFRKHIITCKTEHKAVLDTCRYLEKQGAEVTYLSVGTNGQIDPLELQTALRADTFMLALMYANNETGVIQPLEAIASLMESHPALWFCDASQALAKLPVHLDSLPIDLLCLSAHKMYGPKGVGALYIRKKARSLPVEPLLHGGGQEQSLRGGTLNVPGLVGLGAAAALAESQMQEDQDRIRLLRDQLEAKLLQLPASFVQGADAPRLYNTINITFRFVRAEELIHQLTGFALSTGSACSTGSLEPSHVLIAMGLSAEDAKASIRISLGRYTREEEIESAGVLIQQQVEKLRASNPVWEMFLQGQIS